MRNYNAVREKNANNRLSQFLNDFTARQIDDAKVEVMSFNSVATPKEEIMVEFSSKQEFGDVMTSLNKNTIIEEETIDVDFEIERAVNEAKIKLQNSFEIEIQNLKQQHQKELEQQKENIINEFAENIDKDMKKNFEDVLNIVSNDIAKILASFIGIKIQNDALLDFSVQVTKATLEARKPWTIEGNALLLQKLSEIPSFNAKEFELKPIESTEIRLRLNDTVIATRIEPLLSQLKELML